MLYIILKHFNLKQKSFFKYTHISSNMKLTLRIKIVLMMAKAGSLTQVIQQFKSETIVNVPSDTSITNLYQKFMIVWNQS